MTILVTDVRKHVEAFLGTADWVPVPGRDGVSDVHIAGAHVVKIRPVTAFYAELLGLAFHDVHDALAPLGLAPSLELACYDGEALATVCGHVDSTPERPTPGAVGEALARTHRRLAGVPARSSYPWIGYYGEHAEFARVVPAVADDELRRLGTALLPHCRRTSVPGPAHYVHRDLHPDNVVAGAGGPCFIDWEMVHAGAALDDLAMTALMWAAESAEPAAETVERMLAGYAAAGGTTYELDSPEFRTALALCGLRQGIGGWFSDEGTCTAPYWPYLRARIRTAAELCAGERG